MTTDSHELTEQALRAALAAANDAMVLTRHDAYWDTWARQCAELIVMHGPELLALLDERDALRQDALRYRWLRDKSVPPHNFYLSVPIEFAEERYAPAQVDAAIDAARRDGETT